MAYLQNPRKASLRAISDTVVEVSFPKTANFDYNPGQYIYILVPEISWLQWHPFSISSAPCHGKVTLHVRNLGSWTSALMGLALKGKDIDIHLEGPYGSPAINILDDSKYKSFMLISGGIGSKSSSFTC
jgi:NAD(P)H-flavin reductase